MTKETLGFERRTYIRLDTVFPVQFRLMSLGGDMFLSEWLQGFTNNVSTGGICLRVNNLNPGFAELLKNKKAKVSLEIEMPLSYKNPVLSFAHVAWFQELHKKTNRYLIGLQYDEPNSPGSERIVRYARAKRSFLPAVCAIVLLLGIGLAIDTYINVRLLRGNKQLVEQLVQVIQESTVAKEKLQKVGLARELALFKIQELESEIQKAEGERSILREKAATVETEAAKKIEDVNVMLEKLFKERDVLKKKIEAYQQNQVIMSGEVIRLDREKTVLTEANFKKVYQWLKIHQNPRTGLIMSFEGDSDISNWAFLYDQALAIQAYVLFSDYDRARKSLEFFSSKAEKSNGYFLNAYYFNDGNPAEFILHAGPNIWLGIAALQYSYRSKDPQFVPLAEDIGRTIIALQNQDPDGGVRGGPTVTWYATEHNLDAYSFFNMLYSLTGKSIYLQARDKVVNWLVKNTYNKQDIPILRGKGDSTIATDTYSWSIAALGPEKLVELGMDPDGIMAFAEKNCAVEVQFARPEGKVITVKGFDFASQRNVSRGGVMSSEWTAQMVVSYNIMADYYAGRNIPEKSKMYRDKADDYLLQLSNLIISSPSPSGQGEGCLPYATSDFVDTGHGWMTPKGNSTGSVAGTAYTLFAYRKYNPLELK